MLCEQTVEPAQTRPRTRALGMRKQHKRRPRGIELKGCIRRPDIGCFTRPASGGFIIHHDGQSDSHRDQPYSTNHKPTKTASHSPGSKQMKCLAMIISGKSYSPVGNEG